MADVRGDVLDVMGPDVTVNPAGHTAHQPDWRLQHLERTHVQQGLDGLTRRVRKLDIAYACVEKCLVHRVYNVVHHLQPVTVLDVLRPDGQGSFRVPCMRRTLERDRSCPGGPCRRRLGH